MKNILNDLKKDLHRFANPAKAEVLKRFFKTGKGQYGEGDIFLGIQVPSSRKIAKKYLYLQLDEVVDLLKSGVHEERLVALLIMVAKFERAETDEKKLIFEKYLENTKFINNWDLVDLSADRITGGYLYDKSKDILYRLAKSESLWERRIAIMATFYFIKKGSYEETLKIAELLIRDKHDLIHKAVGWMLREVGKRCSHTALEEFLYSRYRKMPRTMLRYAVERFPDELRLKYIKGNI